MADGFECTLKVEGIDAGLVEISPPTVTFDAEGRGTFCLTALGASEVPFRVHVAGSGDAAGRVLAVWSTPIAVNADHLSFSSRCTC